MQNSINWLLLNKVLTKKTMFKAVDVLQELKKERSSPDQERLLSAAQQLLRKESRKLQRLQTAVNSGTEAMQELELMVADPDLVFGEEEIKNICIRYRMRFLDPKHFKGEIPAEALLAMREFEKKYNVKLNTFKILAPKRLFDLPDADADPLLFTKLADGTYYLLHKWGTDMKWYRRIVVMPFQSLGTLVVTIAIVASLVMLLTPNSFIVPDSNIAVGNIFGYWGFHRITLFFHSFILLGGITIFFWFAFFVNFSDTEWNRKTFN